MSPSPKGSGLVTVCLPLQDTGQVLGVDTGLSLNSVWVLGSRALYSGLGEAAQPRHEWRIFLQCLDVLCMCSKVHEYAHS